MILFVVIAFFLSVVLTDFATVKCIYSLLMLAPISISRLIISFKENLSLASVYRRGGYLKNLFRAFRRVSPADLVDLCFFKARNYLSRRFEIGWLVYDGRGFYDLSYFEGVTPYKVRFPRKRGPRSFSSSTSGEKDVTGDILTFAGPSHNFHGIPTTPKLLGLDSLTLVFSEDRSITFEKDEVIRLDG